MEHREHISPTDFPAPRHVPGFGQAWTSCRFEGHTRVERHHPEDDRRLRADEIRALPIGRGEPCGR